MLKILVCGATGRLGKAVIAAIDNSDTATPVCGIATKSDFSRNNFPIYARFSDIKEKPDVIIDFSSPSALPFILAYATKNGVPAVLCTTGYSDKQEKSIVKASACVALLRANNTSIGVNAVLRAIKTLSKDLNGFDAEITEIHRKGKKDAPSGTALTLATTIKEQTQDDVPIYSIRAGNAAGEHSVYFFGKDEAVILTHRALSANVFAEGAIKAAKFLADKKTGLYSMSDVLG